MEEDRSEREREVGERWTEVDGEVDGKRDRWKGVVPVAHLSS